MNLPILGTLGLLIWAKRQGAIVNLQEQLDALRTVAKFRLSQQVYDEALRQVGELHLPNQYQSGRDCKLALCQRSEMRSNELLDPRHSSYDFST